MYSTSSRKLKNIKRIRFYNIVQKIDFIGKHFVQKLKIGLACNNIILIFSVLRLKNNHLMECLFS